MVNTIYMAVTPHGCELYQHGIKGQKWGVRRFQNADGSLTATGRSRYTNVDGSLNERGKLHRDRYIERSIKRNNKYYDRYQKKYQKKADKAKTKEERQKWLNRKKDAEISRKSLNENIKNLSLDEMIADEKYVRDKVLKTAGAGAATAAGIAMALGSPVVTAKLSAAGATKAAKILSMNSDSIMSSVVAASKTETGKKIKGAIDTGIRTYADARSYVFGTYLSEVYKNAERSGAIDKITSKIGSSVNGMNPGVNSNITGAAKYVYNDYVNRKYSTGAGSTGSNSISGMLIKSALNSSAPKTSNSSVSGGADLINFLKKGVVTTPVTKTSYSDSVNWYDNAYIKGLKYLKGGY